MNLSLQVNIKNFLSKVALCVVVLALTAAFFNIKKYRSKTLIENDIISYYAYLTATFVHHDLTLSFLNNPPPDMAGVYWPETAPNGGRVIKTTMGLAIMYLPFYMLGQLFAWLGHSGMNGYSPPYFFWVSLSSLVYVIGAFFILRKILIRFFEDGAAALTLVTLGLGTNLFFYTANDPLMSHSYIFFLSVVFIYSMLRWYDTPHFSNSIFLGAALGLLSLVRPLCILYLLLWILYGVYNWRTLKDKIFFFFRNSLKVLTAAAFFILIWLPQLYYWKVNTGTWFFNSYQGEHFFFNHPHLAESLIGFRKGWLIYTPLMALSLIGIIFLRKKCADFFVPVLSFSVVYIYILSCWWAWWFGGSFGNRGYMDLYGALTIPLAAFYSFALNRKFFLRTSMVIIVLLMVVYQLFQTLQFRYQAIHYEGMTHRSYFATFLKLHPNPAFYEALRRPDYENAKAGLPERELKYD